MTDRLSALPATLEACACGDLSLTDLTRTWRDAAEQHQPPLPTRYVDVLERLLNQVEKVESAALFSEESCSFSRADVLAALSDWLARARAL